MSKPLFFVSKSGKVVNSNIMEQFVGKAKENSNQIKDEFDGLYRQENVMEPPVNPEILSGLLNKNTYHSRAVQTKATDITSLGWELHPVGKDALESNYDTLYNFIRGMERFLQNLKAQEVDYQSIGYSFAEIVRSNGKITYIYHIPADTMRLKRGHNVAVQIKGVKKVYFKKYGYEVDVNKNTGEEVPLGSLSDNLKASEFYMWKEYTPLSQYYGLPSIMPAVWAIYGDLSRSRFNIDYFEGNMVPAWAVHVVGNFYAGEIDENGISDLQYAIEDQFKEVKNGDIMVLAIPTKSGQEKQVEVKFEKLSAEVKEASFRLFRMDNRDEVLAAHGVPPYRMGIAETGSLGGNVARESTEIYKRSIIEPRQEELENFINQLIYDEFGITDWKFKFKNIDWEDEKAEMEQNKFLIQNAALSPNELRQKYGLDPVEDENMDGYYLNGKPISSNVVLSEDIERNIEEDIEEVLKSVEKITHERTKKKRWF